MLPELVDHSLVCVLQELRSQAQADPYVFHLLLLPTEHRIKQINPQSHSVQTQPQSLLDFIDPLNGLFAEGFYFGESVEAVGEGPEEREITDGPEEPGGLHAVLVESREGI